jgi:hypothetical protein
MVIIDSPAKTVDLVQSEQGGSMDELFRFTLIRPPQKGTGIAVSIHSDGSALERQLLVASDPSARRRIAADYRAEPAEPPQLVTSLDRLPLKVALDRLADAFDGIAEGNERAAVGDALAQILDDTATTIDELFAAQELLRATFLSYVLAPDPNGPPLATVARYLRTLQIVSLYQNQQPALNEPGTVAKMMAAPILLPPAALSTQAKRPWPVGFADLLVVRQHILGYEGGEVARIENVLRGETRKHTRKHGLSLEREQTRELERIEETSEERTTTERQKLSAEIERSLKETWNVKAGLEVGYGGKDSSFFIRANAGFSYDRATEESSKYATELAKEITSKAASRVSERIREVERRRVVETFEELELQKFTNAGGAGSTNQSGIYQFVDKVYRCRVYSYGKRWLMDFLVPEPAAFLLAAREQIRGANTADTPPRPLPLTHNGNPETSTDSNMELGQPLLPTSPLEDENKSFHYAKFVARYGVTGVDPPPAPTVNVTKSFAPKKGDGDEAMVLHSDSLAIPQGYKATDLSALGLWQGDKSKTDPHVFVGDLIVPFRRTDNPEIPQDGGPFYQKFERNPNDDVLHDDTLEAVDTTLPISVFGSDGAAFNLVVTCMLTEEAKAAWRQRTYDQIVNRYQQLVQDYEDQLAAQGFLNRDTGKLGRHPEQNRLTERLEVKKAALTVLEGRELTGLDQVRDPASPNEAALPAPDVTNPAFEDDMARVRFLEQAFEWENLSYTLYPYFWGRVTEWRHRLALVEDDPMFENFLRAGAARVVLAIRPGFENDVFYYLATGLLWSGADLPVIGDPRYLPIVDELRQQAGAGAVGEPYGDDWELRLPTELVRLRPDDELPRWKEIDPASLPPEPRTWRWVESKPATT